MDVWIGEILAEISRPVCILKKGHNVMIPQRAIKNREDHS